MLLGDSSNGGYVPVSLSVHDACMAPTVGYDIIDIGNTGNTGNTVVSDALVMPSCELLATYSDDSRVLRIRPAVDESSAYTLQMPLTPLPAPRHSRHYVGRHWHRGTQSSFSRMSKCTVFIVAAAAIGTISFVAGVLTAVVRFVASN